MKNETAEKLPVLLTVRSEQVFDGVEPDVIELMTDGVMELTETGMRLTYQETELTGLEGTTTVVEVQDGRVILMRTGGVNSQMVFEEGRRHTSLYETPYGDLAMDVQTNRLRHNLDQRGGVMDIHYSIAVARTTTGKNRLQLRVKRKQI